jgi:DNA-binding MarR family transcriptional regulator
MSTRSARRRQPAPDAEPDPFDEREFAAWRGLLRVHTTVTRELDRRMGERHDLPLDAYAILITLVSAPEGRLTLKQLGTRRNLTASGITRSVDRLAKAGLVERRRNPADGRSAFVTLTRRGLRRLREAQVTHHATVRELLFARLGAQDLKRLGALWEQAMPGAVSSPAWPPPAPAPDPA